MGVPEEAHEPNGNRTPMHEHAAHLHARRLVHDDAVRPLVDHPVPPLDLVGGREALRVEVDAGVGAGGGLLVGQDALGDLQLGGAAPGLRGARWSCQGVCCEV